MIESLKEKIRKVPDFPKKGIVFLDITTAIKDAEALNQMIDYLYEMYKDKNIDFKLGYNIIFWGIIGAIVGASIVNKIEIIFLRKMFGIFLILVALYEIYLLFFNKRKK